MTVAKTGPTAIKSVQNLIEAVKELTPGDEDKLDEVQRRTKMVIRRVFGGTSIYLDDYNRIVFVTDGYSDDNYFDVWRDSEAQLLNLLTTMLEEIELFGTLVVSDPARKREVGTTNRVFVVHGHDGEMTQTTARVLEKLDLEPIVLEDEANGGRTVIEKLDRYSDVSFAVILLSPDDMAYKKRASSEGARPRARQNVVHELGYFTGKLGRKNVLALYREADEFEMPSNHSGVLYVSFDSSGHWSSPLPKSYRSAGISLTPISCSELFKRDLGFLLAN